MDINEIIKQDNEEILKAKSKKSVTKAKKKAQIIEKKAQIAREKADTKWRNHNNGDYKKNLRWF